MQKKSFINGLVSKAKDQANTNGTGLMVQQKHLSANKQTNSPTTEYTSMNGTFSGTSVKAQFSQIRTSMDQ